MKTALKTIPMIVLGGYWIVSFWYALPDSMFDYRYAPLINIFNVFMWVISFSYFLSLIHAYWVVTSPDYKGKPAEAVSNRLQNTAKILRGLAALLLGLTIVIVLLSSTSEGNPDSLNAAGFVVVFLDLAIVPAALIVSLIEKASSRKK